MIVATVKVILVVQVMIVKFAAEWSLRLIVVFGIVAGYQALGVEFVVLLAKKFLLVGRYFVLVVQR